MLILLGILWVVVIPSLVVGISLVFAHYDERRGPRTPFAGPPECDPAGATRA